MPDSVDVDLAVDAAGDTFSVGSAGDLLAYSAVIPPMALPPRPSGDIATVWSGTNGDWVVLGGALQSGDDLVTAALISIFTDAQAAPDDPIPGAPQNGPPDPRGWWANPAMGSKLWLRTRSKQTAQTLAVVKNDLAECLQWMIDDGLVAQIDVATAWLAPGFLGGAVELARSGGGRTSIAFQLAWAAVT